MRTTIIHELTREIQTPSPSAAAAKGIVHNNLLIDQLVVVDSPDRCADSLKTPMLAHEAVNYCEVRDEGFVRSVPRYSGFVQPQPRPQP